MTRKAGTGKRIKTGLAIAGAIATLGIGRSILQESHAKKEARNKDYWRTAVLLSADTKEKQAFLMEKFLLAKKREGKEFKETVSALLVDYVLKYGRKGIDGKVLKKFDSIMKKNLLKQYSYLRKIKEQKMTPEQRREKEALELLYPKETEALKQNSAK
jgi:hypothetical protein